MTNFMPTNQTTCQNGQISRKKNEYIEIIVKNFPTKKIPGTEGFTGQFYQIFKEKKTTALHKLRK